MDQGGLLRLLVEMTWFPTAFLDGRYVTWSGVDDPRANVTLRLNGREVACTFEFGEDHLPSAIVAERYRDLADGESVLTPWFGEFRDYRKVGDLLAPHEVIVSWDIDGRRIPYARFLVERIDYDEIQAF